MPWPFKGEPKAARNANAEAEVETWARQRGHVFKRIRDDEGFVIEGGRAPLIWRLEWGPSKRQYIDGSELRIRVDAGLPTDLQALVMTRTLMVELEHAVFADYMDGVQTRLDETLPTEMRWLAMLGKVTVQPWFAPLREPYGGVTNAPDWMGRWLAGRLSDALLQRLSATLPAAEPFVLTVHRGRLTLRQAQPIPMPAALDAARLLVELASFEAQRAVA